MRFGVVLGNDPTTTVREARLLEERGIDTAWFPELPLVGYGDPYVCMALAARETERLRLGTFISCAAMRPAPMLLTHLGTLGRIAPGRVRFGWGSGAFLRNLIGMPTLKVRALREELTVLRDFLDRGQATIDGTPVGFYEWDRACLDLDHMPLEIAAAGPRTAALAGEFGDGLVTTHEIRPTALSALRDEAIAAAVKADRPVDNFAFTIGISPLCVLRPGEALDSPRITDMVEPCVSSYLTDWLMSDADPDDLHPEVRDGYARFRAWAHERYGQDPSVAHQYVRHFARNPEHDQFLTPGVIQACTLTGPLADISDRLRELSDIGVTDVAIVPSLDRPFLDPEALTDLVTINEVIG
jgi:alkanesulfonate monooxygenase SsuD/methylene tetrahydromethanopterin reductase-like flavin-dependent oxidoreductase (luciferase family)